jgi:hypothetical protein
MSLLCAGGVSGRLPFPPLPFIAAAAARAVDFEQLDREGVGLLEGAPDRVVAG